MPDGIRWVGLDVHARESTLAVFDQATGEVLTRRVVGRPHELLPVLREIPRPATMASARRSRASSSRPMLSSATPTRCPRVGTLGDACRRAVERAPPASPRCVIHSPVTEALKPQNLGSARAYDWVRWRHTSRSRL